MQKLRIWLEIAGIFSVVGSLTFVGMQLYQDRDLKKAELVFSMYGERQANLRTSLGENPAYTYEKVMFGSSPIELTNAEVMIMGDYVHMHYIDWQRSAWMERFGIFPEEWRAGVGVYGIFDTPFGRRWLTQRLSITNNLPAQVHQELMRQLDAKPVGPFRSNQEYYDYLRGDDYPSPKKD